MLEDIVRVAAVLWWMFLGAAIVLVIWALTYRKSEKSGGFGDLLGQPCWYRFNDKLPWEKCRIVAVSHKGSISIRLWDDDSGKHAFWVNHKYIEKRVSFIDPESGENEGGIRNE